MVASLRSALLRLHWQLLLSTLLLLLILLHVLGGRFENATLARLEWQLYDARMALTLAHGQDNRIVIVDIDERSLAEAGRWPWSRDKLASLVNRLFDQYHIAVLGFDIVCRARQQLWAARPQATGRGRAGRRSGVSSATGRAGSPA